LSILFDRVATAHRECDCIRDVTKPEVQRWTTTYGSHTARLYTAVHLRRQHNSAGSRSRHQGAAVARVAGWPCSRQVAPGRRWPLPCRPSAVFTGPWRPPRQVRLSRHLRRRRRRRLSTQQDRASIYPQCCRPHSSWRHRLRNRRWARWPSPNDLLVAYILFLRIFCFLFVCVSVFISLYCFYCYTLQPSDE